MKNSIRLLSALLAAILFGAGSALAASVSATVGQSATFSASCSGTAPFSYQWYKDGSAISGATNATYAIATLATTDAASYTVKITNSLGSATSAATSLTVAAALVAPAISTQPSSSTVTAGSAASFTVSATGSAPLSYQWYKDGSALSGATNASLALASTSATDAGSYTVKVTNAAGNITSTAATLTVNALVIAPAISTQPSNLTVTAGTAASFSVVATGTAPLTYQWYKNASPLSNSNNATLSLGTVSSGSAGSYTVKITNAAGNVTSAAATLTVNAAAVAPSISAQPTNLSVTAGQNASFSVIASGTATLSYQWYKDGSALSDATAASLALGAVSATNAGSYTVKVTNSAGTITSAAATLTVTAATVAPTISTQPQSLSVNSGQAASFSVVASGTAPFTYQWFKDGSALSGATEASLAIAKVADTDAGSYTVKVTNSAGNVTSSAASLSLTVEVLAPSITKQPVGQTAYVGQNAYFSVEVSGTAPFSYQWKRGGYAIAGATSSSISLGSVTSSDIGSYTVTITNAAGSVSSTAVALNVTTPEIAPAITTQPASVSSLAGASASFSVVASGTSPLAYQWFKNGVSISGATASSLSLGSISSTDAALYSVTVTNNAGQAVSSSATLIVTYPPVITPPADNDSNSDTNGAAKISRMTNMSVRSVYDSASGPLIIGFNMNGGSKNVLIRATGPALADFGVQGTLGDPTLKIYEGSTEVSFNDNWADNNQASTLISAFNQSGAFGLSNTTSKDAALLTKADGLRTVHVGSTTANARGIVLLEVYDMGSGSEQRLNNLSARNYAGSGADALIVGFTVEGEGTKRILVRGIGPGLAQFGITGLISDPKIEIHTTVDNKDTVLASNDSWQDDSKTSAAFTQTGAFGLPDGSKDAAMVVELPAGSYTAMVSGVNGSTGSALVEVYELP